MSGSPYDIIREPVFTERSTALSERERKYTFRVDPRANKITVKRAIEAIYPVKVVRVNILNVKGKTKQRARSRRGRQPDMKKAIVTLAPGQSIELV